MHALLMLLAFSSVGSDGYATQRNQAAFKPHEHNVIARPFVTHGPVLLAGYFGVSAAGMFYADRSLRRHDHKKLALALDLGVIAAETYCTTQSVRNHR